MTDRPTVLKLGGSVLTEKDRRETLDGPALDRAADAVADARGAQDLVVVHGGGSFGHPAAEDHGLTDESGSHDADAVTAVHGAMTTLDAFVLDRLRERGVPAVPVAPLSAAHRDREGTLDLPTGQVATLLGEGFVPVVHADVIAHAGRGVTVLSGDELVVSLARQLSADRVGLCSSVPGVLDADGEVVPRVEDYEAVADLLGESETTDVTGGMAAKVAALLELPVPASIFDLDGLGPFLSGGTPGTRIG